MPETQLVIKSLYSNRTNETENYSIIYPPAKDIYEHIFGVIQSINYANFIFETPLYLYPPIDDSLLSWPPKIEFCVLYDPISDNCLLINRSSGWEVFLTMPAPLKRIEILGSHVLHPGTWMISVKGQSSDEHHPVLTILIHQKSFSIAIYRENLSLGSKRTIEGNDGMAKRQRLNDGKSKMAVDSSDLIDKTNKNSFLHNYTAREIYNKNISPILDLADGEVAVVEVSTAGSADT